MTTCISRYFVYTMPLFLHDTGSGSAHGLLERSSHIGLLGHHPGDVDYTERVEAIQCPHAEGEGTVHVVKEKGGNLSNTVSQIKRCSFLSAIYTPRRKNIALID